MNKTNISAEPMLPLLRARVRRYATVRLAPIFEVVEALPYPEGCPLWEFQLCPKPPHRRPYLRMAHQA